ncbi:2-hydroxyisoflavanone dehydratase [Nicotiana tabacum]|uniref:2-hydroxyisoflavanone dehydratase n=2 Tax=Nicotiana TaxID=4085 RepID=A0A1S4CZN2_TOBAC|nr:PREDICTED: 2-hydroxyisoflavanone dehydratase-like [Nicotiana sylvestris]XP_016506602.1 PREDICTED: 2-hydroxyisoflavanone dehydratase-like [Nicotiana tabacum]
MAQNFTHLRFPLSFLIICLYIDSTLAEKAQNFYPFFRVDTDGTIHRYQEAKFVPPSFNPETGVQSKDVTILPEQNVSARLYLPKISGKNQKFPLLVYIHGGGFCTGSASSPMYDSYLHKLTAESNTVAVSIEYRLAPEYTIPACYDDSWAVMKWVEQGTDPWLKEHADFSRVYLAGDSAGANIAHNMMVRASEESHFSPTLIGMALIDPYFGNDKPDSLWTYLCPKTTGIYDPRFNPAAHPRLLSKLNCSKVLVCTAGKDFLRDRAWTYYENLKKSGWKGEVGIKEIEGEDHVFHLYNQTSEKAKILMKSVVDFLVYDDSSQQVNLGSKVSEFSMSLVVFAFNLFCLCIHKSS